VLVDVVLPGSRRLTVMSVAIAIIALPLGWGVAASIRGDVIAWPTLVLCGVVALVGVFAFAAFVMKRHQRRAEQVLRECADQGDGVLIGRLARTTNPISISDILVKHGRWGVTSRLARERDFTPVEPICVPFEPQLLGAGDPPGEVGPGAANAGATAPAATRRRLHDAIGARVNKASKPLGSVISLAVVLALLWISLRSGWTWIVFVLILCLVVELLRLLGPGLFYAARQCLAVPGGLVVRESGFLRQSWRLHVYDRRASVLTAARKSDTVWFVQVADAAKKSIFMLKPADVEFLLRAWVSPLRPPGVERLSDLQ
jgi:hypothetical protein